MSLAHLLDRANLRQNQIANSIGVSQATVSQWFNGKRRIPSDKLRPVARLLGASLDELVPEETGSEEIIPASPSLTPQPDDRLPHTHTALPIESDEIPTASDQPKRKLQVAERYEP